MKILLAIDNSRASQLVVRQVARQSWPPGTSAEVLSVFEAPRLWNLIKGNNYAIRKLRELTEQAAEELRAAGLVASSKVMEGDPRTAVPDRCAEVGADFAIVGTHGTSGLQRFVMGSVASAVLRFAPCSVELVRPKSWGGSVEALEPDAPLVARSPLRILAATDGSACSEVALRSIADRPWTPGTEIRILSLAELVTPPDNLWDTPAPFPIEELGRMEAEAREYAREAAAAAKSILSGVDAILSESTPAEIIAPQEAILAEGERWKADLIVMGSHGRRGISRLLIGSVSEAVATHAGCSVDVIRPRVK